MRTGVTAVLAVVIAIAGCTNGARSTRSDGQGAYFNSELGASFRVPAGWHEPSSFRFGKPPYAARLDSPAGDAAAILAEAPLANENCSAAARTALRTASGSALASEHEFTLHQGGRDWPAGEGETSSGARQGMVRYFCRAQSAVVLEASAPRDSFTSRKPELGSIVDSLVVEVGGERVAVRAPIVAPPAPTYFVHTVKFSGQTLAQITEWYTGSYDNWPKLARANGETVPNVALKVGREIRIPTELVVKKDPLPEPRKKRVRPKAPAAEEQEEAPELPPLIGPK
jgi:hypothetical protein